LPWKIWESRQNGTNDITTWRWNPQFSVKEILFTTITRGSSWDDLRNGRENIPVNSEKSRNCLQ